MKELTSSLLEFIKCALSKINFGQPSFSYQQKLWQIVVPKTGQSLHCCTSGLSLRILYQVPGPLSDKPCLSSRILLPSCTQLCHQIVHTIYGNPRWNKKEPINTQKFIVFVTTSAQLVSVYPLISWALVDGVIHLS